MTKHIDESFRDWEGEAFGFGYGSGEEHVLTALQIFFLTVEPAPERQYDYEKLEKALGGAVAHRHLSRRRAEASPHVLHRL